MLRKAGYSIYERSVPVTSADIAPGALKEARHAARHRRRALRGRDATRGWHATCNVAPAASGRLRVLRHPRDAQDRGPSRPHPCRAR